MYSTCTIHRQENEDMVRYLTQELAFEPVSLAGILPEELLGDKRCLQEELRRAGKEYAAGLTDAEYDACIQLLPGYMEADGFFMARFIKK